MKKCKKRSKPYLGASAEDTFFQAGAGEDAAAAKDVAAVQDAAVGQQAGGIDGARMRNLGCSTWHMAPGIRRLV